MGGVGSGEWRRLGRKSTVEDSLTLQISDLGRIELANEWTETLSVGSRFGKRGSIRCSLEWNELPSVELTYLLRGEEVLQHVQLESTKTQFGGKRWWFKCLLDAIDEPCERRTNKLHLPPGKQYFGCRHCYDLTYESCQVSRPTAKSLEGLLGIDRIEKKLNIYNERQRKAISRSS